MRERERERDREREGGEDEREGQRGRQVEWWSGMSLKSRMWPNSFLKVSCQLLMSLTLREREREKGRWPRWW